MKKESSSQEKNSSPAKPRKEQKPAWNAAAPMPVPGRLSDLYFNR